MREYQLRAYDVVGIIQVTLEKLLKHAWMIQKRAQILYFKPLILYTIIATIDTQQSIEHLCLLS